MDTSANTLTAREYLWNSTNTDPWAATKTIRLFPARAYAGVIDDPLNPGQLILLVVGNDAADDIQVRSGKDGQIEVNVFNGSEHRAESLHGPFNRVVVDGLAGADHIQVENQFGLEAWLYGGEADDHVQRGGGASVVLGFGVLF